MKSLLIMSILLSGFAMAKEPAKIQTVDLAVTDNGFEPSSVNVKPNSSVTLKITRKTDSTCATQIQVPAKNIKKDLPLNETVVVDLGKLEKGEVRFGCGMDMMVGGQIHVK